MGAGRSGSAALKELAPVPAFWIPACAGKTPWAPMDVDSSKIRDDSCWLQEIPTSRLGGYLLGFKRWDDFLGEAAQLFFEPGFGLAHGEANHYLPHAGVLPLDLLDTGDGGLGVSREPGSSVQHEVSPRIHQDGRVFAGAPSGAWIAPSI